MRLLLTGASGQLGRALAPRLAALGRLAAPGRAALDLARPETIERGLDAAAPDLIVNAGAYTDVDGAERDQDLALRINGEAPGVLGRWAARHGALVIHVSTDFVFGGGATRPIAEDATPDPINAYGRSKLAGERNLLASGAPALVLRTGWLYGPVGNNFLRRILAWARDEARIEVVGDQTGSPTTTLWLAAAIATLIGELGRIEAAETAARAGIYHACCRGAVDRCSLAREIVARAKAAGLPLACREVVRISSADRPGAARRPAYSALASDRLSAVWGIAVPHWRDALDEVVAALARDSG